MSVISKTTVINTDIAAAGGSSSGVMSYLSVCWSTARVNVLNKTSSAAAEAALPVEAVERSAGDLIVANDTRPFDIRAPARSTIVFSEGDLHIEEVFRVLDTARKNNPRSFCGGFRRRGRGNARRSQTSPCLGFRVWPLLGAYRRDVDGAALERSN